MKVKSESEVAQSTLSDPMDFSLPGSSIHGIFQARVLEWGAIAFSNTAPRGQEIGEKSMARALIHSNLGDTLLSVKCHTSAFLPIPSPQAQK